MSIKNCDDLLFGTELSRVSASSSLTLVFCYVFLHYRGCLLSLSGVPVLAVVVVVVVVVVGMGATVAVAAMPLLLLR